jgi:pyruvate/2-oxoacid:ferredoxin oxidoreductase alpha subunit
MVVQDGYFVSHIAGEVEMPSAAQVDAYLPPYQLPFALDPRRPVSHGPQIHPEQGPPLQLERARAMEDAIPVIRQKTDEFATAFGRRYPHFVEEYLLDDGAGLGLLAALTLIFLVKRPTEQEMEAAVRAAPDKEARRQKQAIA